MTDTEITKVIIARTGPAGTGITAAEKASFDSRLTEIERVLNSQIESLVSTRWYGPLSTLSGYPAVTGVAMIANEFFASPVYIPHAGSFNVVGIEITTAAAAGGTMRLGIYNVSSTTGLPTSLIQDFGTIDTTVAGRRTVPISLTLQRGSYWLAGAPNLDVSSARTLAQAGVTATMGHIDTTGNTPRSGLKRSTNLAAGFTALPAEFGAGASITSIFAFWLQAT